MESTLLFLIPLLPLVGFLINGLLGWRFSKRLIGFIGCAGPFTSSAIAIGAFLALIKLNQPLSQRLFDWVNIGGLNIDFTLRFDPLSATMVLIVTIVGSFIHLYSIGYMRQDKGYARYFAFLNLFMFMMLVLVMADNLVLMFLGWEGVGLCSYLLIGFWYEDLAKADAGKKAFIVNRVGDFGFILGLFLLYTLFGTLTISQLKLTGAWQSPLITVSALLLFMGACGKSAQIPLYVWLPDAMAGPTPVSALIHAATMVTAGVYMICRLDFLFIKAPLAMEIVGIVAGVTALYTAIIALAQTDIKKILAYSTISQLGYMFMAAAATGFAMGIFHLMTHAFFKALLFLGAGAVIHALTGEQDITKMGGLAKLKPLRLIFITFLIGALAISGLPPLAGFFSKDAILIRIFENYEKAGGVWLLIWLCAVVTAFLTAFYIFRLVAIVFFGPTNLSKEKVHHLHPPDWSMKTALVVLAILSFCGGIFGKPLEEFLGWGKFEDSSLAHNLNLIISVIASTGGILLAMYLYIPKRESITMWINESRAVKAIHKVVANKFYVDELYDILFTAPLKMLALGMWYIIDRILIDTVIVEGTAFLMYGFGGKLRKTHTGLVNLGAGAILVGAIAILGYIFYLIFRNGG